MLYATAALSLECKNQLSCKINLVYLMAIIEKLSIIVLNKKFYKLKQIL